VSGPVIAQVPRRVRQAFQVDALFELAVGLVLMGNPLLGPDVGVSAYVVLVLGLVLLVAAVLLGAAGLGKGPLAGRVVLLMGVNAASGVLLVIGAVVVSRGPGRVFVLVIAVGLLALAALQLRALRQPIDPTPPRRRATPEELLAAMRGEQT
jgi:hypothetical protein